MARKKTPPRGLHGEPDSLKAPEPQAAPAVPPAAEEPLPDLVTPEEAAAQVAPDVAPDVEAMTFNEGPALVVEMPPMQPAAPPEPILPVGKRMAEIRPEPPAPPAPMSDLVHRTPAPAPKAFKVNGKRIEARNAQQALQEYGQIHGLERNHRGELPTPVACE